MDERIMDEIYVELGGNTMNYTAEAYVLPFDDVTLHASSYESSVQVIADLRRGLAYMGIAGRIELYFGPYWFLGEEEMEAVLALSNEELTITPEDTQRVRREAAEGEKRASENCQRLLEFMGAQAGNEEEEESITVGEAFRRANEGKELMRKIVEGEEPDADQEGDEESEHPSKLTP